MKHYHFIGIGGIGMSGLARILLQKGNVITGSDLASSYVTEGLEKEGAKIFIGHSAEYIASDMVVVYSSDVKPGNVEYDRALQLKCTIKHRSDLLFELMQPYRTLAVAGTHGKTTTSALLATTLLQGDFSPSFAVGGILPKLHANAGHGKGDYFVAEADESDGTFVKYSPFGSIVTNIDLDHMDHFGSEQNLILAFQHFMKKTKSPEHLFWCADDSRLVALKPPGIGYGFSPKCELKASHFKQHGWKISFDIDFHGRHYSQIEVALTGHHSALNALAVFGMAITLGIKEEHIRTAFANFGGVLRRCEKKAEVKEILLLDDYAHHPTEIRTTLNGIRQAISKRRLIAIFQPHRYTRTKQCLGTYGGIFDAADEVIVTDIYGARETPIPGITHEQVLAEIQESKLSCRYVPRKELAAELAATLQPQDVAVSLGAGDITKFASEIVSKLNQE